MNKNDVKDLVESIDDLTRNMEKIADAVTHPCIKPAEDAVGGYVMSLTEAVMGVTAGLVKIAESINNLADAVSNK